MMRVAFLGLGIMGSRMAGNLARKGFELAVWNRTSAAAEAFGSANPGVRVAATPEQAAAGVDVVITMVVDGPQVEAVLLGPEGAASGAAAGTLFLDCSTIGVAAAQTLGARLAEGGFAFVDAPVTGSSPRAQAGTLTIMAGGSPEDFERARTPLEAMGSLVVHAGPVGHGQLIKVINNAVAAINATTLGQALLVGAGAGANLDALVAVMAAGSGASAMLELKAAPMRAHDYSTLFTVERSSSGEEIRTEKAFFKLDHMLKDVRLCLAAAERAGVPFQFGLETEQILSAASEAGHGEHDFAALITALEDETGPRLR
jgi:3-hydroxyisobutyrate dehydrogenase-like beta-hydroxyacid dehydrogenase